MNVQSILEAMLTCEQLEQLYMESRSKFVELVGPKIRFAFAASKIKVGKLYYPAPTDHVIFADPADVIKHTSRSQRILPYAMSNQNHIRHGKCSSRQFAVAAHCLTGGYLDAPQITIVGNEIRFNDGRHRTALAMDCGIKRMPFYTDAEAISSKRLFSFTTRK